MKNQQFKRGQILLILVLLLATTITIVLTTSLSSIGNTQTTKLEEESQKALSVAEAGIDKALAENAKNGNTSADIHQIASDFTGSANVTESNNKQTFTTQVLQKDEEYTFYLASYNRQTNTIGNGGYAGTITVYYETGATSCFDGALELTLIYDPTGTGAYKAKRFIADAGSLYGASTSDNIGETGGSTIDSIPFNCHATAIPIVTFANPKLLIVKALVKSTPVSFSGDSTLPVQGKTVSSIASSPQTGVTKQVELFQSYPQIPSDFFTTSF